MTIRKFFSLVLFYIATGHLFSQQNYINVPSSELTAKHKLFFQQQLNFNEILQSNTTVDYGFGGGFEAGFNVLGLNYSTSEFFIKNDSNDRDPYNPLVTFNTMKRFELSKHLSITNGLQWGANFRTGRQTRQAGLLYANLLLRDIIPRSSLVAGMYYNTRHYGGEGNRIGAWLGSELEIIEKLHLLCETIIGNNALCFTSMGFVFYARERVPLTLAIQIPNTRRNAYSIVFELTIIPKK